MLKKVYQLIPFKHTLYKTLKRVYTPPHRVYQHLHFKGIITIDIDKDHQFKMQHLGYVEENEIFWNGLYGGWEKLSVTFWVKLSKISSTILDIGANTGLYGLVAQSINSDAKVFCFEPIPSVFNILKNNIEINSLPIVAEEIALSNYNGDAKIYLNANSDFAYSVTVNKNTIGNTIASTEVDIKTIRLDTYIEANKITSIDLMKVDVETHEIEVLEGMGVYLNLFKPSMIIEVLDESIANRLNLLLEGMGYLYFNIDDANSTYRQTNKITKSDYWNYLICNEDVAKKINLI